MMSQLSRLVQHRLGRVLLLAALIGASLVYVVMAHQFLSNTLFGPSIVEHQVEASPTTVLQHWNAANMNAATIAEEPGSMTDATDYTRENSTGVQAAQEQGQPPLDGNSAYPLTTVGKIFFSDSSGRDYVCSGTAVVSANRSVVDTAGHCLYWESGWVKNFIFCPLYDHGKTPYGCWAARELLVPSDWVNPSPNDLHHDMGMAVVSPNDAGYLTDLVGGAGWAYNQRATETFYAYGYPAARPFDGQSRQSCEGQQGTLWQHGGGQVVSIPCNMTGGSSGGGWFIKNSGQWYLNGHNDFTSSMKRGHMFSPYYDDTWFAMYNKAQDL